MDTTITSDFDVAHDRSAVLFEVSARGRVVRCSVARDALVDYFWLKKEATSAGLQKVFVDGRKRITAVAQRKALKAPVDLIELTARDFEY
jgi:hypothetical protein